MAKLEQKEVDRTKWTILSNSELGQYKIELHKNTELEISIFTRNREHQALCGLVYLRLEDFIVAKDTSFSLPIVPQGVMLVEASFTIPRSNTT